MALHSVGISGGIPKYICKFFPLVGTLCLGGTQGNGPVRTYPCVRVPILITLSSSATSISDSLLFPNSSSFVAMISFRRSLKSSSFSEIIFLVPLSLLLYSDSWFYQFLEWNMHHIVFHPYDSSMLAPSSWDKRSAEGIFPPGLFYWVPLCAIHVISSELRIYYSQVMLDRNGLSSLVMRMVNLEKSSWKGYGTHTKKKMI